MLQGKYLRGHFGLSDLAVSCMINPLKRIYGHPLVQQFVGGWRRVTDTFRRLLGVVFAPIHAFLQPLYDRWFLFAAPARAAWSDFSAKNPRTAWSLGWLAYFLRTGIVFITALIFLVGIGVWGRLPGREALRNIETANATEVYSEEGQLIGKYYIENRTAISLDNVSPHVINALIATEDKRFFEHSGIDLISWARVAYGMATGKQETMGGGSTLSQQLAKNLYPRQPHRILGMYISSFSLLVNKIKEYFISIRLEKIYTKNELLSLYLNTVPFGGDIFGIGVASKQYFNKKAKELTPDQAATLIGMLKATTFYNPARNPENALKRRNIVLRQMTKNGHLTEAEYTELSQHPVGARRYSTDGNNEGLGTYFREHLRVDVMPALLRKIGSREDRTYNLYTDGLKIHTTLNASMQKYAEEAVQEHMSRLQKQFDAHWKGYTQEKPWGDDKWVEDAVRRSDRWLALKDGKLSNEAIRANFEEPVPMTIFTWKNGGFEVDTVMKPIDSVRYYFCLLNCGFMAMDHSNGYVRAWVGGTNFRYFKYDHIKGTRQVGSTFKPIVYAAALRDSIKPCSFIPNQMVKIKDWEPHNYNDRYGGYYSLIGGLQKSVNVVAAQLIEKVGIQKTLDLARNMGVTAALPREFGISLGACDISLYDMIKVYGTIGNAGVRPEPVLVLKITDRTGRVLYDYKEELKENPKLAAHVEALTTEQASMMRKMMQNVIDFGTGSRLRTGYGITSEFAGKTGTTQNHADGWFICFNPSIVTGAWVGGQTRAVRFRSMGLGQGSAMALPIVGAFWSKVYQDSKLRSLLDQKFPEIAPEIQNLFGCPNWIGISPSDYYYYMQDSVMFDSLRANHFRPYEGYISPFDSLGSEPESGEPYNPLPDDGFEAVPEKQLPYNPKKKDGGNQENLGNGRRR